jgi:hypothetical protein
MPDHQMDRSPADEELAQELDRLAKTLQEPHDAAGPRRRRRQAPREAEPNPRRGV